MIHTDAKENVQRIENEKNKRIESKVEEIKHENPSGQASGQDFEKTKNEVISELEGVLAKLRRMQGNSNQELTVDKEIPKDTESVT